MQLGLTAGRVPGPVRCRAPVQRRQRGPAPAWEPVGLRQGLLRQAQHWWRQRRTLVLPVLLGALVQSRVVRRRFPQRRPSSVLAAVLAAVRVRAVWTAPPLVRVQVQVQQLRPASARALRREPVQEQHPLRCQPTPVRPPLPLPVLTQRHRLRAPPEHLAPVVRWQRQQPVPAAATTMPKHDHAGPRWNAGKCFACCVLTKRSM